MPSDNDLRKCEVPDSHVNTQGTPHQDPNTLAQPSKTGDRRFNMEDVEDGMKASVCRESRDDVTAVRARGTRNVFESLRQQPFKRQVPQEGIQARTPLVNGEPTENPSQQSSDSRNEDITEHGINNASFTIGSGSGAVNSNTLSSVKRSGTVGTSGMADTADCLPNSVDRSKEGIEIAVAGTDARLSTPIVVDKTSHPSDDALGGAVSEINRLTPNVGKSLKDKRVSNAKVFDGILGRAPDSTTETARSSADSSSRQLSIFEKVSSNSLVVERSGKTADQNCVSVNSTSTEVNTLSRPDSTTPGDYEQVRASSTYDTTLGLERTQTQTQRVPVTSLSPNKSLFEHLRTNFRNRAEQPDKKSTGTGSGSIEKSNGSLFSSVCLSGASSRDEAKNDNKLTETESGSIWKTDGSLFSSVCRSEADNGNEAKNDKTLFETESGPIGKTDGSFFSSVCRSGTINRNDAANDNKSTETESVSIGKTKGSLFSSVSQSGTVNRNEYEATNDNDLESTGSKILMKETDTSPPPTGKGPSFPPPEGCINLDRAEHYTDNFPFTERLRWISKLSRTVGKEGPARNGAEARDQNHQVLEAPTSVALKAPSYAVTKTVSSPSPLGSSVSSKENCVGMRPEAMACATSSCGLPSLIRVQPADHNVMPALSRVEAVEPLCQASCVNQTAPPSLSRVQPLDRKLPSTLTDVISADRVIPINASHNPSADLQSSNQPNKTVSTAVQHRVLNLDKKTRMGIEVSGLRNGNTSSTAGRLAAAIGSDFRVVPTSQRQCETSKSFVNHNAIGNIVGSFNASVNSYESPLRVLASLHRSNEVNENRTVTSRSLSMQQQGISRPRTSRYRVVEGAIGWADSRVAPAVTRFAELDGSARTRILHRYVDRHGAVKSNVFALAPASSLQSKVPLRLGDVTMVTQPVILVPQQNSSTGLPTHPRSIFNSPSYPADYRGDPVVNLSPSVRSNNVVRKTGLSCSELVSPSPTMSTVSPKRTLGVVNTAEVNEPNITIPEARSPPVMLFRPVSPKPTHAQRHLEDMDKDDQAYAYALNESANSPDIERMLRAESPTYEHAHNSDNQHKALSYGQWSPAKFVFTSTGIVRASTRKVVPSPLRRSKVPPTVPAQRLFNGDRVESICNVQNLSRCPKISNATVLDKESVHTDASNDDSEVLKSPVECLESCVESESDQNKKRKNSLNVIKKRLEPKLPSPVRDLCTSDGDLYRDPSELTREERALQRAMLRFSEMERREREKRQAREEDWRKRKRCSTQDVEDEEVKPPTKDEKKDREKKMKSESAPKNISTSNSRWFQKVKKKQKLWISQRHKVMQRKPVSEDNLDKQTDCPMDAPDSSDPTSTAAPSTTTVTSTADTTVRKIKKRKNTDKTDDKARPKKRKKSKKKIVKTEPVEVSSVKDHGNTDESANAEMSIEEKKERKRKILMKKKLKEQKMRREKRLKREHSHLTEAQTTPEMSPYCHARQNTRDFKAHANAKAKVKTYMLVASYQGFKDFQPVVMESRTRRRGTHTLQAAEPEAPTSKPEFPLLVVESVNSKPVKERVVAESEEVQKLVTECLRKRGMWRGDELEQALKREEAALGDEAIRLRDSRKLTVNRTTGETILHKAARLGYHEVVKQCILQGADPTAKDNAGWTPLHEACARGKLEVVKVLAQYGADVNAHSNDGIRPLHDAAEGGHVEVLRLLLTYGADPMLATYAGNTAYACAKEPKTKRLLKEYILDIGHGRLEDYQDVTDGWSFGGSCSFMDNSTASDRYSGIWREAPPLTEICEPEFEVSDQPHLPTYNLPVMKDGVVIGRKNYMLLDDLYEKSGVAKTTLQKRLRSVESLEMPWAEFMDFVSESSLYNKPPDPPAGTSDCAPVARLVPLNYTARRLLNIRIEPCR
ncbi:uncharacterized protein LOC5505435 isoform X3 [Nematostella vectensis]|uniref:uncharacterized protein LOC5505435 isoform X3 n=1 Tax=Nematostella vectensis TaxID=45351 RepID=UPI0020772CEA|nr:uncharacterized protein LOC5505435 isoform X3 [Nematostella vectensis]